MGAAVLARTICPSGMRGSQSSLLRSLYFASGWLLRGRSEWVLTLRVHEAGRGRVTCQVVLTPPPGRSKPLLREDQGVTARSTRIGCDSPASEIARCRPLPGMPDQLSRLSAENKKRISESTSAGSATVSAISL